MKKTRRKIDACSRQYRSRALREQSTIEDLAQRCQIQPNQICLKKQLIELASRAFERDRDLGLTDNLEHVGNVCCRSATSACLDRPMRRIRVSSIATIRRRFTPTQRKIDPLAADLVRGPPRSARAQSISSHRDRSHRILFAGARNRQAPKSSAILPQSHIRNPRTLDCQSGPTYVGPQFRRLLPVVVITRLERQVRLKNPKL